ncbi:hypothetical protein NL676_005890 [Syzygium grande]|nr:hypothetical protein NL676_005890 [Syzygium grande]
MRGGQAPWRHRLPFSSGLNPSFSILRRSKRNASAPCPTLFVVWSALVVFMDNSKFHRGWFGPCSFSMSSFDTTQSTKGAKDQTDKA